MTDTNEIEAISFQVEGKKFEMPFVKIPGGKFMMGTPAPVFAKLRMQCDLLAGDEEEHEVEISSFYMAKYHVTRGQFSLFVKDTAYRTEAEKGKSGNGWDEQTGKFDSGKKYTWRYTGFEQTDDHPVVNVTWNDAQMFCEWLRNKSGRKIGLPSEAQWEYACRAGTTTLYYFGDDVEQLVHYGNTPDASFRQKTKLPTVVGNTSIAGDDGYAFTSPVGQYKPNPFGLYDMHGNVWQWCEDFRGHYQKVPKKVDPVQLTNQLKHVNFRVIRGGSWFNSSLQDCRSASRIGIFQDGASRDTGFRVLILP